MTFAATEKGKPMKTCNDCIHQELCDVYSRFGITDAPADDITICELFKDKADFAKVRRGRWLPQRSLGNGVVYCSECKTLGSPHWNWCPLCGDDMRGEKDDSRTEN